MCAPKHKKDSRPTQTRLEHAFDFAKKVYTLEYLNGKNGEYRRSSFIEKVKNQPGRALLTAIVYGSSMVAVKLLCDVADSHGFWTNLKDHAQAVRQERDLQDYQNRQRERYQQALQEQQADQELLDQNNVLPINPDGRNQIRFANPLPGGQLHLNGIPRLQGFYHMQSNTPYHNVHDGCGVNVAYNMAFIEAHVHNRQVDQEEFDRILHQVFPQVGQRGAYNDEVSLIAQRMNLAPVIELVCNRRGEIERLGRAVRINANVWNEEQAFQEARMNAARDDIMQAAREFRRGNGIRVVHFLCGIPGHWVGISVTRNAQNQQAMYLYDNLNNRPHAVEQMRRHVENIYNHFFQ